MNRGVRFLRKSSASRTESSHKYLKPGALAQMRNSRISARSYRVSSLSQIYLHRMSSLLSSPLANTGQPLIDTIDDLAHLAGRVYGPSCLKRKKLAAIKSAWFPSPSVQTPTSELTRDPIIDLFNSDHTTH